MTPAVQAALDSGPAMLWVADLTGRRFWVSASWCAYTGRGADREQPFGWLAAVHVEDRERCVAIYRECFGSRAPLALDYRMRRHDGHYRWVLDRGAACHDAAGNFAGFAGATLDVHERRELEDGLAERSRRLRFELRRTSGVGRDVPIGAALASTDGTDAGATALGALVPDVGLSLRWVAVGDVLARATQPLAELLTPRGHRFVVDLPEPELQLLADPACLGQAIGSALVGACNATTSAGTVTVTVRHHQRAVFIRIRTDAAGRAPEFVPRAFELFMRHEAWRPAARPDGDTLPMDLIAAVRSHGGEATLTTDGGAAGYECVLRLPLLDDDGNAQVTGPAAGLNSP